MGSRGALFAQFPASPVQTKSPDRDRKLQPVSMIGGGGCKREPMHSSWRRVRPSVDLERDSRRAAYCINLDSVSLRGSACVEELRAQWPFQIDWAAAQRACRAVVQI